MRAIKNDLIELVFEGLTESTALRLAEDVVGRPVILPAANEGVVDIELPRLEVDEGTALQRVHVRILRYDGRFDIELNFVPRDAEGGPSDAIIDALHQYAIRLSQRHHVDSYYAGLEPAVDEETRFFTGTLRGPY